MEIVIKIDDERYKDIQRIAEVQFESNYFKTAEQVIANGTPLPKGHGVLKDTDKIISDGRSKGFCNWYDEMKYAPTIIEADKE